MSMSRREFVRAASVTTAASAGALAAMAALTRAHAAGEISPELAELIRQHDEALAEWTAKAERHNAAENAYFALRDRNGSREEAKAAFNVTELERAATEALHRTEIAEQAVMEFEALGWPDLVAKARTIRSSRSWNDLLSDDANALVCDIIEIAGRTEVPHA